MRSREILIRSYDALLKQFAPSAILMTYDGTVLNWFGAAGQFIDTLNNLADWTVQDIVHPDLHFTINVGIEKLRQGQFSSHSRRVSVTSERGEAQDVLVEIEALQDGSGLGLVLARITLADQADAPEPAADGVAVPTVDGGTDGSVLTGRIHTLERDLKLTEETLQHVTERLEASGEELQASNEELQASNEELQASNEELQSSNEELHAVNEELVSVSAEHERKIEELSELNSNTELVLRLMKTGVIVLDAEDKVRRFSQLIGREFLLQDHDIDRSIATIGPRLDFVDLQEMTGQLRERGDVQAAEGTHDGRPLRVEARTVTLGPKGNERDGAILLFGWT